jgi:hypothetical protein
MDLPEPPVQTIIIPPVQRGRRFGRLLRVLAAGCTVAALLGADPLANWAANDNQMMEISSVQYLTTALKNATESLGLAKAYAWIRRQARVVQDLRFAPPEDQL